MLCWICLKKILHKTNWDMVLKKACFVIVCIKFVFARFHFKMFSSINKVFLNVSDTEINLSWGCYARDTVP